MRFPFVSRSGLAFFRCDLQILFIVLIVVNRDYAAAEFAFDFVRIVRFVYTAAKRALYGKFLVGFGRIKLLDLRAVNGEAFQIAFVYAEVDRFESFFGLDCKVASNVVYISKSFFGHGKDDALIFLLLPVLNPRNGCAVKAEHHAYDADSQQHFEKRAFFHSRAAHNRKRNAHGEADCENYADNQFCSQCFFECILFHISYIMTKPQYSQ